MDDVVVIKTENGPVRIDKSEFNEKQHTLHVADEHHDEHGVSRSQAMNNPALIAPVAGAPVAPIVPSAATAMARQFGVLQNKNKFFVVDGTNGTPVTDIASFDAKGYGTNKEAWEAITAAALAGAAASTDNAS